MLEIPRLTLYNKADKVADFTPTQTPFSLISARSETAREDLQALLLEKTERALCSLYYSRSLFKILSDT